MTSKIVVNNIESDTGISTVTFASDISSNNIVGNLIGNVSGNINSTGISTVTTLQGSSNTITIPSGHKLNLGPDVSLSSSGISTTSGLIVSVGGNEDLIVDTAGRVSMPFQPAFYVEKSFGNTNTFITGNTTAILTWNNIKLNQGGHFSSGTGRFTAPISGIYLFTFHVSYGIGAADNTDYLFYSNGSGASETVVAKNGTAPVSWANGALIMHIFLNVNDFVTVGAASYNGNVGSTRASFGGRFLG